MASKTVYVAEETESYVSVHVQFKLAGIDFDENDSTCKVVTIAGREYPLSRFGTLLLRQVQDQEEIDSLLSDGGVPVAIVWALMQTYSEVTAWVSSLEQYKFTLDVKKSAQKRILDEIANKKMAKCVEQSLRNSRATLYKNIRIKLIKIVTESGAPTAAKKAGPYEFVGNDRLAKLLGEEKVTHLMEKENHSWAFMMLKRALEKPMDDIERLGVLLRLCSCAIYLKKAKELDDSMSEIISLMKSITIEEGKMDLYDGEIHHLIVTMSLIASTVRAVEFLLAWLEMWKRNDRTTIDFDVCYEYISRIGTFLNSILKEKPGACLKIQIQDYFKQAAEFVAYIRKQRGYNTLAHARCVYYCEYELAAAKKALTNATDTLFGQNSIEFKRLTSCWADLPFVICRLRLHPEVAEYLADGDFVDKLTKISRDPMLLKKELSDPQILKANEVLTSEFGIFLGAVDVEKFRSTFENENADNGSSSAAGAQQKPPDKKAKAQREKELGNEAYKKKQFTKALSHYDKAIDLDPADAMLHSNKAAVYISQEKLSEARSSCLTAVSLAQEGKRHDNKDVAKITARLARVEFLLHRPEKALELYQRSLRLNFDPKVSEQAKECEEVIGKRRFADFMRSQFY